MKAVLDCRDLGQATDLLRAMHDPTVDSLMKEYPTSFLFHVLLRADATNRPLAAVFAELVEKNADALAAAKAKWLSHVARSHATKLATAAPWHPVACDMGVLAPAGVAWHGQRTGPMGETYHLTQAMYRRRYDPENPVYYVSSGHAPAVETEAMYEAACIFMGYPVHMPRVSNLAAAKLMLNALFVDVDLSEYVSRLVDQGYGVSDLPRVWANLYPLLERDHAHRAAFVRMAYNGPADAFQTAGAHGEYATLGTARDKATLHDRLESLRSVAAELYAGVEDDVANGRPPRPIPLTMARSLPWPSDAAPAGCGTTAPMAYDVDLHVSPPGDHDPAEAVIDALKRTLFELQYGDMTLCAACGRTMRDGRPIVSMDKVFCSVACATSNLKTVPQQI